MNLSSPDFTDGQVIPRKFASDGIDINPQLDISQLPAQTRSLVLLVDDPTPPSGRWVHWLVYDIPPTTSIYRKNTLGTAGLSDFHTTDYSGPRPPEHRHSYRFTIYALDTLLHLQPKCHFNQVNEAMQTHIIAHATITGRYPI
jgi:Raf kinase inhibitor-like YbhB/YbcL family protein